LLLLLLLFLLPLGWHVVTQQTVKELQCKQNVRHARRRFEFRTAGAYRTESTNGTESTQPPNHPTTQCIHNVSAIKLPLKLKQVSTTISAAV